MASTLLCFFRAVLPHGSGQIGGGYGLKSPGRWVTCFFCSRREKDRSSSMLLALASLLQKSREPAILCSAVPAGLPACLCTSVYVEVAISSGMFAFCMECALEDYTTFVFFFVLETGTRQIRIFCWNTCPENTHTHTHITRPQAARRVGTLPYHTVNHTAYHTVYHTVSYITMTS